MPTGPYHRGTSRMGSDLWDSWTMSMMLVRFTDRLPRKNIMQMTKAEKARDQT